MSVLPVRAGDAVPDDPRLRGAAPEKEGMESGKPNGVGEAGVGGGGFGRSEEFRVEMGERVEEVGEEREGVSVSVSEPEEASSSQESAT